MTKPTINVFIDRYHPKQTGECSISICISHQRKRRFYPIGISMKADSFDMLMKAKRRTDEQKEVYKKILAFESRANSVADELDVFTFTLFEELYLSNREATDSIAFGFTRYINQLREQGRISTAISFESALKSIEEFRAGMRFADITPEVLAKLEKWMMTPQRVKRKWKGMEKPMEVLREPLSKTTVGMYMRSLRAVMNRAKINPALYPFSKNMEKGKYIIPTGRNIKKALKPEQIASMYKHPTTPGTLEDMAKDYWFFMYLCNGMNLKDVCLLKWKNKDGDTIRFLRSKTINTKRKEKMIEVHLKPMAKAIISKWGQPSIDPNGFVFPHIRKDYSPEEIHQTIHQLTKNINKYMNRIARAVGIERKVTTYFARHSFATVLRNSGASVDLLSNLLGHSTIKQTAEYLDGFEKETIEHATNALITWQ